MDFHFSTNVNQPFPQWFQFSTLKFSTHSKSKSNTKNYTIKEFAGFGISCFLWIDGINEETSQIPLENELHENKLPEAVVLYEWFDWYNIFLFFPFCRISLCVSNLKSTIILACEQVKFKEEKIRPSQHKSKLSD